MAASERFRENRSAELRSATASQPSFWKSASALSKGLRAHFRSRSRYERRTARRLPPRPPALVLTTESTAATKFQACGQQAELRAGVQKAEQRAGVQTARTPPRTHS